MRKLASHAHIGAHSFLFAAVAASVFCPPAQRLDAQTRESPSTVHAGVDSTSADSSAPRSSEAPGRQNLWLSGGIGSGGEGGSGLASIGSAWYAYGPVVLGARLSEGAPWERETDIHDRAALIGARLRSAHAFILGAIGAGRLGGSQSNGEQSGTRTSIPDETSVAFGLEGGLTYHVIGIGLDVFGARSQRLSYSGVALSIQLGYLE